MSQQQAAWCYRSGGIEFGPLSRAPKGAIVIAHGRRQIRRVRARARQAYDNKSLLVPGLPEADNDDVALEALCSFVDWIRSGR